MTERNHLTTLQLTVDEDRAPLFSPLLAKGFRVKTKVGCSVRDLLCSHLGLSPDYMDQRIQTIFLDGKAVDTVEDAVVGQGSTLALSAAMPGLVGATLRRGGAYASMRCQITHNNRLKDPTLKDGTIVLKLFNLVAEEIGPRFLTQGVRVSGENVQRFFKKAPEHFWQGCHAVQIDGKDANVEELHDMEWQHQQVFLKLIVKP